MLASRSRARSAVHRLGHSASPAASLPSETQFAESISWRYWQIRHLATVRDDRDLPESWFSGNIPRLAPEPQEFGDSNNGSNKPPDDRTLKLGTSALLALYSGDLVLR